MINQDRGYMALTKQSFNPQATFMQAVKDPSLMIREAGNGGYSTTSNAYFKYVEAERKISRNERVIMNLDKNMRHVKGYPHTLINTETQRKSLEENNQRRTKSMENENASVLGPPSQVQFTLEKWNEVYGKNADIAVMVALVQRK